MKAAKGKVQLITWSVVLLKKQQFVPQGPLHLMTWQFQTVHGQQKSCPSGVADTDSDLFDNIATGPPIGELCMSVAGKSTPYSNFGFTHDVLQLSQLQDRILETELLSGMLLPAQVE